MHAILRSAREHQAGKRTEWDGLAESPRYKFRNESLIGWLEITPEEERKLKTTISGDERRRRDHERDEKRSRDPFCPYSPKCVEEEFSEVRYHNFRKFVHFEPQIHSEFIARCFHGNHTEQEQYLI